MSLWVRNRNAITGEAEALWFGASLTQKGIVVALMLVSGGLGALLF
jgi:hypothetical protein